MRWETALATERVERKLAAILAADIAGYSRLMGADEEGTLARLKSHRRELIDPKIAEHRGRIVKTTGDGLLVEFGSVVDALRCATELQANMAERNAVASAVDRIDFRIGIHQGDVVVEDGDIFGDGVNVAARLEGLAEPGGICVSARVQEDASGRLDLAFEDMGEQALKNIARPVRVYRVRDAGTAAKSPSALLPSALPLPDKPSIAVLPFANMSGDPEQEYFADGMVEEIIFSNRHFSGVLDPPAFAGSSKVYAVNPRTPPSLIFSGFPGTITPELHTAASASSPSPPLVPRFSILAVVPGSGRTARKAFSSFHRLKRVTM